MNTLRIYIVGVGGQGNVLASKMIGEAALSMGVPVLMSVGRFDPAFARYAGTPSGCALRRSAEFAGFLPHDLYRCADADYRELS